MQIEKIVLEKAADTLLEKAEDCFDLAKTQHHLRKSSTRVLRCKKKMRTSK
jgi:hypothetical protein